MAIERGEKFDKVVDLFCELTFNDKNSICKNIICWDGTFSETELDWWYFEDIVELYCYNDIENLKKLLIDARDKRFDPSDEFFYFDADNINSTNMIDYDWWADEVAEKLIEDAGTRAFREYDVTDEQLRQAIANAANIPLEEL